jgi:hypothetical protein
MNKQSKHNKLLHEALQVRANDIPVTATVIPQLRGRLATRESVTSARRLVPVFAFALLALIGLGALWIGSSALPRHVATATVQATATSTSVATRGADIASARTYPATPRYVKAATASRNSDSIRRQSRVHDGVVRCGRQLAGNR